MALKEPSYKILYEYQRAALMKLLNEPMILMAHSKPIPWYKRSRLLHPLREFRYWLHRDCGWD